MDSDRRHLSIGVHEDDLAASLSIGSKPMCWRARTTVLPSAALNFDKLHPDELPVFADIYAAHLDIEGDRLFYPFHQFVDDLRLCVTSWQSGNV